MSGASILDFGTVSEFGNLAFPDLERHLELRLASIKSLSDLDKLIQLMNPFLRDNRFSAYEKTALKRLRQRAYDRKRNPKFQALSSIGEKSKTQITESLDAVVHSELAHPTKLPPLNPFPKEVRDMPNFVADKTACQEQRTENFAQGVLRAFSSVDGEHFIKTTPKLIAWFVAAAAVSFFLWHQSLALYETAGFDNATYAAAGGILMIVGLRFCFVCMRVHMKAI